MINIAICDDDETMTTVIEEMLCQIAQEQSIEIDCAIFFDGSSLVGSIRQGDCYDLIYLDIEMRKVNGIGAAEMIRNMELSPLIVYVSCHEQYLKELFDTEPFRFLSKPVDKDTFRSVFLAAYKRIRQRAEYFYFTYNREVIKVPLGRSWYFESRGRVIYIYVADGVRTKRPGSGEADYKFYGKMNDVEKQLSERNVRFIRIHQSYLVNFDYIRSINFTNVTMPDGRRLQISEERQKNVRTRFCTMAEVEVPGNE